MGRRRRDKRKRERERDIGVCVIGRINWIKERTGEDQGLLHFGKEKLKILIIGSKTDLIGMGQETLSLVFGGT